MIIASISGPVRVLSAQLAVLRGAAAASDPADIARLLQRAGMHHRILLPLAFAGHTLESVVHGVLLLVRNWRLMLVELVPAVWIGAITWNWRAHVSGRLELVEVHGSVAVAVAVFVVTVNLVAYWCNAVFAFTLSQGDRIDLSAAFRQARQQAKIVNTWAISIGALHAYVAVFAVRWSIGGFAIAQGFIAIIQMYALVALPAALAGLRRRRKLPVHERLSALAITATLTGLAVAPGLGLNRAGVVLIGLGLAVPGGIVLTVAIVLQVAATSSARAVKLAANLATPAAGIERADDIDTSATASPARCGESSPDGVADGFADGFADGSVDGSVGHPSDLGGNRLGGHPPDGTDQGRDQQRCDRRVVERDHHDTDHRENQGL
jgi:hypothetical protein